MYYLIFKGQHIQTGLTKTEFKHEIGRHAPERFYEILGESEFNDWKIMKQAQIDAQLTEEASQNEQPESNGTLPA